MKNLPTLFKKSSKGADQSWDIGTKGAVIVTRWGQIGGSMQETEDVVKTGKNIGRANETTAIQQAEAEAQSRWEKKLKRGYVKNLADARAGKVDDIIEGGVFPMLAHRFDEHGHKLSYPAFAQPKLDGHRCIAIVENGECSLWSRKRKRITSMPHIVEAIEGMGLDRRLAWKLDGELYNHDYHSRFQKLSSFITSDEPKSGGEIIQYHVYDLLRAGGFDERHDHLKRIFGGRFSSKALVLVETKEVKDEDELMLAFEYFRELKYEGAMARNKNGNYISGSTTKRSYDLLKLKEFIDEEFPVIAVEEGRGKMAGHAIFVCKTSAGQVFNAKMKGKIDDLRIYFSNPRLAVGRQLTVQFQGWTDEGKPRFPVAQRFKIDL